MDWMERYRDRLPEHVDCHGDIAPPWEKFPEYERYTIGWRMGAGEDWLGLWHAFLASVDPAFEARLAYLKRHAPAPFTWANAVYSVLYPPAQMKDYRATEHRSVLIHNGLIASDAAYTTWLNRQTEVVWPWSYADTPVAAARYWTREFWFWSRQVKDLVRHAGWTPPRMPRAWRTCAAALESGTVAKPDPRLGLLMLAQSLAAGSVPAPWELGLKVGDFADTFDDGMGYVDAFRLWGMSALDDGLQLERYLDEHPASGDWLAWVNDQFAHA